MSSSPKPDIFALLDNGTLLGQRIKLKPLQNRATYLNDIIFKVEDIKKEKESYTVEGTYSPKVINNLYIKIIKIIKRSNDYFAIITNKIHNTDIECSIQYPIKKNSTRKSNSSKLRRSKSSSQSLPNFDKIYRGQPEEFIDIIEKRAITPKKGVKGPLIMLSDSEYKNHPDRTEENLAWKYINAAVYNKKNK